MKSPSLSVVITCYNEQKNLQNNVLDPIPLYLRSQDFSSEVIIVNDGSTDDSLKYLQAFARKYPQIRIIDLPHGGKPSGLLGGIKAAKNDIILFTDIDQSTPISEYSALAPYFSRGYDIVIGSRGQQRQNFSLVRKLGSFVFSSARRLFILPDIADTQCGFKAFRRPVVQSLFPKLAYFQQSRQQSGWRVTAYDVELLFRARKQHFRIKEVPVKWQNLDESDTKGNLSDRYRRESVQMAQEVIRVLFHNLRGHYDHP